MRTALRAAVTLVTACAIAPTLGTPVGAVTTCPGGESICLYIPAGDYPVSYPLPETIDQPATRVPLARVCDSSGSNCIEPYLELPALYANSPAMVTTVHFPGAGVGVNGALVTIYASPPTTSPGDWSGATLSASVNLSPIGPGSPTRCIGDTAQDLGPVAYDKSGCMVMVTVRTRS